jgi:hypothetical protein
MNNQNLETIQCDICLKKGKATKNSKYLLQKEDFIIYCDKCARKLRLNKFKALEQGIKIYKF